MLSVLLLLSACTAQYGLPIPGYGYPGGLSRFAPRMGNSANYVYYPQFEAYYHPSSQQFYYPNGKNWEVKPTVLSSTARDVRATPGVPFQFPDHPSNYHDEVKQAFPTNWTPSKGRFNQPYEFGRSGWDIDRR